MSWVVRSNEDTNNDENYEYGSGGSFESTAGDTRSVEEFRQDQINNYQAPEPEEWNPEDGSEAPRAWDIHYTPSWFIEEQQNRKNPDYKSDSPDMTDEFVNSLANYASAWKQQKPDEWRYGDPGWDTSSQVWQENIKPLEDDYVAQKEAQAVQQQQLQPELPQQAQPNQPGQYYMYHNNNVKVVPYQRSDGNGPAFQSEDYVNSILQGSQYDFMTKERKYDYDTLSNSGKLLNLGMPSTNGTDVENAPAFARWSRPLMGAAFSASGPANLAKLAVTAFGGPVGWAYGATWAATAGYSYAKGTGLIKGNKVVDKVIEMTDILDEKGAQIQGALAYGFEKAGGGDWTDWSKAGDNFEFLMNNFGTIMHYAFGEGRASSDYNSDVVGIITSLTPNIGANVVGLEGQGVSRFVRSLASQLLDAPEDKIWLEKGQTTRSNVGQSGVFDIPEEMLGTNAITYWLDFGQYLYDHGITNKDQLELIIGNEINKVYGDLANLSEFIEHELGDPGNVTENMQSRAMNVYGNAIGDTNLANAAAANTHSLLGDLAGNIPVIPDVARAVAKQLGYNDFLKTSGGIDEVLSTWNDINLLSDPSTLTPLDRRISGITEEGGLKSLTPNTNPSTVKNPIAQTMTRIKNLFQTTNEWRATMVGDSIFNFISLGIEDAMSAMPGEDPQVRVNRVRKFVDELENPESISDKSPFYKQSKTVLFNSIKDDLAFSVRQKRGEINRIIEDYSNLERNRQTLTALAEALGLTPDKVMQKYNSDRATLAQMIVNKADQNGGTLPGIDIPVEGREFGQQVLSMLEPFAGDKGKAYDPRALMTQITTSIGDSVTDTLINKYGIEAEGWVYRFGDTIKKLQNLWLLGLSPSYLANNVVNNVLTRSALGWGGFLTGSAINTYMERFGWTPDRFAESMAEGILETAENKRTNSDKLRESIRVKKKGEGKGKGKKDALGAVDSASDWMSKHAGIFGKISGKIEEMESKQVYASAMMTYMARTWKPGVNFRKMDKQLEAKISEQNPEMLKAIYGAISGSVNIKEIEDAIYGTYIIPSIQDSLVQAAREANIDGAEDAIVELFQKGGIYEELQRALRGKRGEDVDKVVEDIITRARAIANIQLAEDIARRAEQVANDTNPNTGYGFAEAVQLGQDMAENLADVWIGSQDANTQLFNRRIRENMSTEEFRKMYVDHQKVLNERWAGLYATVQQNYNGILKGLGFADDTTKSYVNAMIERDNLWVNFYNNRQPELFQPYLDALEWKTDDTFEKWDARVKKAWEDYRKAIGTEYENIVKAEQKKQIEMDNIFAEGLKASLDKTSAKQVDKVIKPLQEQIRNKRQEIVAKNKEIRDTTDKTSALTVKNNKYREAQAERQQLVTDLKVLQQKLYNAIRDLGPKTAAPAASTTPTPVADVRADVVERTATETQQTAEQLADMNAEEIADTEKMPESVDDVRSRILEEELASVRKAKEEIQSRIDALVAENNLEKNIDELKRLNNVMMSNNFRELQIEEELSSLKQDFTPKNWKMELNKKNLYKAAKALGASDELAVAITQLNRIHANEWESNNPGKKYKDVGGMTLEYIDEDRTVPVRGADGQLYQVETIDRADVNTPEFKAWHGDHPENFNPDGTPLSVWHGSDAFFLSFAKELLGKNTGAPSAKLGFFTAGTKETAQSYIESRSARLVDSHYEDTIAQTIFHRSEAYRSASSENFRGYKFSHEYIAELLSDLDYISEKVRKTFDIPGNMSIPTETAGNNIRRLSKAVDNHANDTNYYTFLTQLNEEILYANEIYNYADISIDQKDSISNVIKEANHQLREKKGNNILLNLIFDYDKFRDMEFVEGFEPIFTEEESREVRDHSDYLREKLFAEFPGMENYFYSNRINPFSDFDPVDAWFDYDYANKTHNATDIDNSIERINRETQALKYQNEKIEEALSHIDTLKEQYNIILKSPEDPHVRELYLSFNNPYVVDYQGKNRADVIQYSQAIRYAIDNGNDAVILKNTYDGGPLDNIYVVFNEDQMKSVYNSGEWSDPKNIYHRQQEQRIKGQFSIQDSEKMVELFRGSDMGTLIHEAMGHGWATTLNDNQIEALAAYNGWTSAKYRQLEHKWYYEPETMSQTERQEWVDSQERFAYGFEQYLLNGVAPNSAMKELFEKFRRYLLEIYKGVRHILYKGEPIDIYEFRNGVALYQIFDSMLYMGDREFNIDTSNLEDVNSKVIPGKASYGYVIPQEIREYLISESARQGEKVQKIKTAAEEKMRVETQNFLNEYGKKWNLTDAEAQELVVDIMHDLGLNQDLPENPELMHSITEKIKRFPGGIRNIDKFIRSHRSDAAKINDTAIDAMLKDIEQGSRWDESFGYALNQEGQTNSEPETRPVEKPFEHGAHTIVSEVYQNGEAVAYVPQDMGETSVEVGDKKVNILGVSPEDPSLWVYQDGDEIYTTKKREDTGQNNMDGQMDNGALGALDPMPQANHQISYEQIIPILEQFKNVYKRSLNDAMANKMFGSLDDETKELVRQYIDVDVRQDLQNAKFKTGKFGESMRDAALLNYSKRYGFDNALTLLFPYQFWQTRSMWNWLNRMGGKGGKMWRRYARLKAIEERNKKEMMPSRTTGKVGIYIPFLPEWMGDALFMPTSQLSIVGNFMDPLLEWSSDKNAIIATAERYVQEAFNNQDISLEEYQKAMDPARRSGSAVWDEMYAKAQLEGSNDKDFGSLCKQYFGMSLPASITSAVLRDDAGDWNQTPMTRTGTAWRALFGDNIIGKAGEFVLSAPERALRAAVVGVTGKNDFRYTEFGAFGDYYIRNQLWDMVVEGRISAENAIEAQAEKDGNKYWEMAADRQRQEVLQKTQLLSATMPFKQMVEHVRNGEQDKLGDDVKYLFAELLTMWTPASVVRDAERTWREDKAELSKLYDTNDKKGREQFHEEHPYYTYNNLRYEDDPEQALRSYLYKSITQKWFDLDKTEQAELKITFGDDFERDVINKETRAIESMDLNRLAAYAQALNGSIPYLATDALNTMNVPKINMNVVPQTEVVDYRTYVNLREKLYPGMADVEKVYYNLPVEDRKMFRNANPNLTKYWNWKTQYMTEHPNAKNFSNRQTNYYNTIEAENVISVLDEYTIKALTVAAYSKQKLDKTFRASVEYAMGKAGVTDKYDDFEKILKDYILGK